MTPDRSEDALPVPKSQSPLLASVASPSRPCRLPHAAGEMSRTLLAGFTEMTEKFSTAMYMDRGAEQLVELLNHYISAIVESECPRGPGCRRRLCAVSAFEGVLGLRTLRCPHEMWIKPVFSET